MRVFSARKQLYSRLTLPFGRPDGEDLELSLQLLWPCATSKLSQQKPKSHREPTWKKAGIKNASVSPAQHSSMTRDKYICQIAYQTAVTT